MSAASLVLSLKNEELEGQEATAEQFMDVIRGADRGLISAEKWAAQYALVQEQQYVIFFEGKLIIFGISIMVAECTQMYL
jgi:hypothetical protein